ncbi:MAG: helix-turn-helix domain-containing protein [Flavobacteriaceae bacterium]
MDTNKELDLAWDFICNTNRSVFLTGKAGTGKTTFLHKLRSQGLKRMVVVAPTGVAAMNAKGVTVHSFFQLPFGPILPNTDLNAPKGFNRKFSKTKIDIIKSMDLLVIDEISMVRADLLDGIDRTLRRFRDRGKVFGGVQVLMIGDLQQLAPVVKDNEWGWLRQHYKNIYFFSSLAFGQSQAVTIELKRIYRQEDPKFIEILNAIRNDKLTEEIARELNKRYIPDFAPEPNAGYISLTTHNRKADAVNHEELEKLNKKKHTYKAVVEGKFPEYNYPNDEKLVLSVGAQVMFVKNDSSAEKRYFNGKIGKVILLEKDEVVVHCPDDDFNINVTPEVWENINYSVDAETKAITEDRIGAYTQMPLRLAWSITIHKSQGLTFNKAIIDAQDAFSHGQTYVALSRCKSLEGLVLKGKISANQIINDSNVAAFTENAEENAPDGHVLELSKKNYQLDLIFEIFNFNAFLYPITRVLDIYYKNRTVIEGPFETTFLPLKEAVANFLKVANKFQQQLNQISEEEEGLPESNNLIQERFKKAKTYFKAETEIHITKPLKAFGFTTDNKALKKDLTKQLDTLDELITVKQLYFENPDESFKTKHILEQRTKSVFVVKEKPKPQRKDIVEGTKHVVLFENLRMLRDEIAKEEDVIHYQVFTQKALYGMCQLLPTTKAELLSINGIGKVKLEKYGDAILSEIKAYCDEYNIEASDKIEIIETPKQKQKPKISPTKAESLSLFQSGKSVAEIADFRELTEDTIFGHLVSFIPSGEIKITDLISKEKYEALKTIIPQIAFEGLTDLKQQLDDEYSYAELRLVVQGLK